MRKALTYCSVAAVLSIISATYEGELKTSPEGLALIASYEGCVSCTYTDQVGVKTIGIGSIRGFDGKALRGSEKLSDDEVARLFMRDVKEAEVCVQRHFNGNRMPQSVFDSTVSLVYNVGCYGARYNPSANRATAIARYAQSENWASVCYRLSDFRYAGGKVNRGLENRRAQEQKHCVGGLQ